MPNRRQLLQLGLSGLTVSGVEAIASPLLASNPRSQRPSFGKAKNVIVMFTWGGMSHIDTFDMKPEAGAEIRGSFSRISTSIPGTKVCEHLPKMSQMLHELTVVRSVHHTAGDHRKAAYWNITMRRSKSVVALQRRFCHPEKTGRALELRLLSQ